MKKLDAFGDKYLLLNRTPTRDAFWFRISRFADHSILWFVLAFIRFLFLLDPRDLARFVITMAIESALTNGPIKYIFKKSRPHEQEGTFAPNEPLPYKMRRPITSSFPSGHATAAMTAACLLSSSYHWFGLIFFPLGLLVAYSRIYTRMHHLSDVLGGLVLGLIFGYLATRFIVI